MRWWTRIRTCRISTRICLELPPAGLLPEQAVSTSPGDRAGGRVSDSGPDHLRGCRDLRPQLVPAGADGRTRLSHLLRTVQHHAAVSAAARSHHLPEGRRSYLAGAHPPAGAWLRAAGPA